MSPYPTLFTPIKVGAHQLKNRIIMSPVTTGLEGLVDFENEWVNFYQARSSDHGPGLFNIQHGAISFSGKKQPDAPFLDHVFFNKAFRLTSFLRSRGSEVILQLMHHGLDASHFAVVASSKLHNYETLYTSHKIPSLWIEHYIRQYAQQAANAVRKGGFSGVEVYGGKLSLPNTFTCPVLNKRTDNWGQEYHFRFAKEVVRRIRDYIGPTPLLSYRLTLMDFVPEGNSWTDLIAFVNELEHEGVDMLSFDFGLMNTNIPTNSDLTPRGVWYPFINEFSKKTTLPVTLTPPSAAPEAIEAALTQDNKTLVELDKALVADPQWGEKVFYGKVNDVNPCVHCSHRCITETFTGERIPLCCVSNPYAVFPFNPKRINPDHAQEHCLIVGGGPAGMAAAEHAARKGVQTVLIDEKPFLGGMLRLSAMIPGRERLNQLLDLKEKQLLALGVEVIKGIKVTREWIEEHYPQHTLILATGCIPSIPDIPGIDSLNVLTFEDLLYRKSPVGHRVAVIGDSRIALDTARYLVTHEALERTEWLRAWGIGDPKTHRGGCQGVIPFVEAPQGATYWVTELQLRQLKDALRHSEKLPELQWILMNGVQTITEASIESIDTVSIKITTPEETNATSYRIDHVVIAGELEPRDELIRSLEETERVFHTVGSVTKPNELFGGGPNMQSGIALIRELYKPK